MGLRRRRPGSAGGSGGLSPGTTLATDDKAWWLSVFLFSRQRLSDSAWASTIATQFANAFDLREDEKLTLMAGHWVTLASLRPVGAQLGVLLGSMAVLVGLGIANCSLLVVALLRSRAGEIATKRALGAGVVRLVASELAPVAALTFGALGIGVLLANTVLGHARGTLGGPIQGQVGDSVSFASLAPPLAVVLGVALLASVGPLLGMAESANVFDGLKRAAPTIALSVGGRVLMAAKMTMCVMVTGLGAVMVVSIGNLLGVSPNLDVERVVFVRPPAVAAGGDSAAGPRLLRERLGEAAGVRCASHITVTPLSGDLNVTFASGPNGSIPMEINEVGADILCAVGATLVAGRDILATEEVEERKVAVISSSAATALFGDAPAVGRTVRVGFEAVAHTVVGIFADPKFNTLREAESFHLWVAARLDARKTLVVHSGELPAGDVAREAFWSVSGARIETLGDVVARIQNPGGTAKRFMTVMSTVVLLSTIVALYAWISAELEDRRTAAAILSALGACRSRVGGTVLKTVGWPVCLGATAGAGMAIAMLRTFPTVASGIGRPWTLIAVAAGLEVVVVLIVSAPKVLSLLRPNYRLLARGTTWE